MSKVKQFLDGLKQASSCADVLCHEQRNPRWLEIRDMLERLHDNAAKMAMAKSMTELQVLSMVNNMELKHRRTVKNSGGIIL